ncbi:MAG: hypothetical protein SNJ59_03275 [Aggregatilineales bacterium]
MKRLLFSPRQVVRNETWRARLHQPGDRTELYKADDEPGIIGELQARTLVTVLLEPHMGRQQVRTDDGLVGWASASTLTPSQSQNLD